MRSGNPLAVRARLVLVLALISSLLPACATQDSASPELPSSPPEAEVTSNRITMGIAPGRRTGQVPIDALHDVEQVAGRVFDIVRTYSFWDDEFPDLRHRFVADRDGSMLHVSISARRADGSVIPWAAIADAVEGDAVHAELMTWIDRLAAFGKPIRVTFHHEPDIEPEFGTPEDFVRAWRRIAGLLDEAAPNVETVWVLTSFNLGRPLGAEFWPGEEYVDYIGADAFNWYGCRGTPEAWRSPQEVLAPLMTFGAQYPDKPLVLAELGSDEDPQDPERKAAWFAELGELVAGEEYRRLDTIVFFHNDHEAEGSTCDWWLDSSESSAVAFADLTRLEVFGVESARVAPARCPIVAITMAREDDLALVDGDGDGAFDFEFGNDNAFVGVGDQSRDGVDHRVLFRFDPLPPLAPDAILELRVRVAERQPALNSAVDLVLVGPFDSMGEAFAQPGEVLEPGWFDATTVGGHHVVEVSGRVDPTAETVVRLQLSTPPVVGDGQNALFVGTANASRSIDRPALIARSCE